MTFMGKVSFQVRAGVLQIKLKLVSNLVMIGPKGEFYLLEASSHSRVRFLSYAYSQDLMIT